MYVCGITPYDATHLGHAATMIAFDLVHRCWRDAGTRSATCRTSPTSTTRCWSGPARRRGLMVLGMRETALFRETWRRCGSCAHPLRGGGGVDPVDLRAGRPAPRRGVAYRLESDVYFDLAATPRFGYESNLTVPPCWRSRRNGRRPRPPRQAGRARPLLWRGARDGEPAWDGGPIGPGRPAGTSSARSSRWIGWATPSTCRAAATTWSSRTTECSAAHAEALTAPRPFARHYVHAGMIGLAGEDVQVQGNLVFVSRLRGDGVDPMAVRLALMAEHYRTDPQWTDDALKAAQQRLARWRGRRHGVRPGATRHVADVLGGVRIALAEDWTPRGPVGGRRLGRGHPPRRRCPGTVAVRARTLSQARTVSRARTLSQARTLSRAAGPWRADARRPDRGRPPRHPL